MALTLSPSTDATDPAEVIDISGDGLTVDRDVYWTLDFTEAEAAGMAARVPLQQADVAAGFDRVVVAGVKGSLDVHATADRLTESSRYHYARGLAILRQGMPTNNLSGSPSAYPPPDPTGSVSFNEREGPRWLRPAPAEQSWRLP